MQIGEHHIVDASSEEEVCTLARYAVLFHLTSDAVMLRHLCFTCTVDVLGKFVHDFMRWAFCKTQIFSAALLSITGKQ